MTDRTETTVDPRRLPPKAAGSIDDEIDANRVLELCQTLRDRKSIAKALGVSKDRLRLWADRNDFRFPNFSRGVPRKHANKAVPVKWWKASNYRP